MMECQWTASLTTQLQRTSWLKDTWKCYVSDLKLYFFSSRELEQTDMSGIFLLFGHAGFIYMAFVGIVYLVQIQRYHPLSTAFYKITGRITD